MATIKLTGLTNLQARIIFNELEDNWDDLFTKVLNENDVQNIDLEDSDIKTDEEGDINYSLVFCNVESEEVEDEPGYEAEDCICKVEMEKNGIEYTPDFTPSDDKKSWICDHCGRTQ